MGTCGTSLRSTPWSRRARRALAALAAASLALAAAPAPARTVAGVEVPEEVALADGTVLRLNGAGVRRKLFVKVYVGALYLPRPRSDPAAILAADEPQRVEMRILYRRIGVRRMRATWEEGLRRNHPPERLERLRPDIERSYAAIRPVRRGDVVTFTYRPGEGMAIAHNGRPQDVIPGRALFAALLGVWLGPRPPDEGLKRAMLGRQ